MGAARPIALVIQAYASLPDYAKYSKLRPPAIDLIVNQYLRFEHLRRNADQIFERPTNYVFLGRITLTSVRKHASNLNVYLNALGDQVDECDSNITKCVYPDATTTGISIPKTDYAARLEMPLPVSDWLWTEKEQKMKTDLATNERELRQLDTPGSRGFFRQRILQLRAAITFRNTCIAWLDSNRLNMYIRARTARWLEDTYRSRSPMSDAARRETEYEQLDWYLLKEFQKEGIPFTEVTPIPARCWV